MYQTVGRDETIFDNREAAEESLLELAEESGFVAGDIVVEDARPKGGRYRLETYWHKAVAVEAGLVFASVSDQDFAGMTYPI